MSTRRAAGAGGQEVETIVQPRRIDSGERLAARPAASSSASGSPSSRAQSFSIGSRAPWTHQDALPRPGRRRAAPPRRGPAGRATTRSRPAAATPHGWWRARAASGTPRAATGLRLRPRPAGARSCRRRAAPRAGQQTNDVVDPVVGGAGRSTASTNARGTSSSPSSVERSTSTIPADSRAPACNFNAQPRLAYASRTRDRHQAARVQRVFDTGDVSDPADEPIHRRGETPAIPNHTENASALRGLGVLEGRQVE